MYIVLIGPAVGIETSIGAICYLKDLKNSDVIWQNRVEPKGKALIEHFLRREVCIEVGGMYAGIGTTAAAAGDTLAEESGERDVEFALNGFGIILHLPSIVAGAVVCQMYEVAQGLYLCAILNF